MYSGEYFEGPRNRGGGGGGGRRGGGGARGGRAYDNRQYDNRQYDNRQYDNQQYDNGFQRGGGGGGRQNSGFGRQSGGRYENRGRGGWGNNRGRNSPPYRGGGRGGRGPRVSLPNDVEFVSEIKGHKKVISAMLIDPSNGQLYTGSTDGFVRVWDMASGQLVSAVEMGGEVDSILLEGGFLCVGLHNKQDGLIKVWNTATSAQSTLLGHKGQVYSLAASMGMLFSGGHDKSIRVWKYDAATQLFAFTVALTVDQGGHDGPVQVLLPVGQFLFSADWLGQIKVWDMSSGQCTQTVVSAHKGIIMGLLQWEGCILSCGLDGYVRVWQPTEVPSPGAVLDPTAVHCHPPQEEPETQPQGRGKRAPPPPEKLPPGVLSMVGSLDQSQKPVLIISQNSLGCASLWDLPTFSERGHLPDVMDARAMVVGGDGLMVTGDSKGTIKLFRWKPVGMPVG